MATTIDPPSEGWADVGGRKWHYLRDGRSLCGKWMTGGVFGSAKIYDADQGPLADKPSATDCAACWRKRKAEEDKAA